MFPDLGFVLFFSFVCCSTGDLSFRLNSLFCLSGADWRQARNQKKTADSRYKRSPKLLVDVHRRGRCGPSPMNDESQFDFFINP
jgi:hypothetical protein